MMTRFKATQQSIRLPFESCIFGRKTVKSGLDNSRFNLPGNLPKPPDF